MATLASGWTIPGRAPSAPVTAAGTVSKAGPGTPVVDPTPSGTARLILPFVLAVVVVVIVAGLAFGTGVHQGERRPSDAASVYSVPKTT